MNSPPSDAPLRGRRILVTAGPTWVYLDAVRHIGNLSSGRTGLEIARRSRERSDADLIVANDLSMMGPERHPAWIMDRSGVTAEAATTAELAEGLVRELALRLRVRPFRPASSGGEA